MFRNIFIATAALAAVFTGLLAQGPGAAKGGKGKAKAGATVVGVGSALTYTRAT